MNDTSQGSHSPNYRARAQYSGCIAASYDADRQRTAYDRFKWRREEQRLQARLTRIAPDGTVLDLPTGTGRLLGAVASVGRKVIGADISRDMLQLAATAAEHDVPLVQSEAEQLPFADKSFDLVISIRFFQHLPPNAIAPILTEMVRVSERGVLVQAPITKVTSRAVKLVADVGKFLLHRGPGRPPLRRPLPTGRYFPSTAQEFEQLLATRGLRLVSSEFVTWPWSQLTLMHITRE